MEVIGAAGRLTHDTQADDDGYRPPETARVSPYLIQLTDFVVALTDGTVTRITASEAVAPIRVTEAAYASTTSAGPVPMRS